MYIVLIETLQAVKDLVAYARRRRFATVKYDDAEKAYCPDLLGRD
jgi:hypothetical protein